MVNAKTRRTAKVREEGWSFCRKEKQEEAKELKLIYFLREGAEETESGISATDRP